MVRRICGGGSHANSFSLQRRAVDPEAIAAMTEAFDAAREKLGDINQPEVAREVIAGRIIAVARLGERDPARLLEAALSKFSRTIARVAKQVSNV
jgi:hypothetical protein